MQKQNRINWSVSKLILWFTAVVLVYIVSRAIVFQEIGNTFLAVGIIIGFGIGTTFFYYKTLETKRELKV